MEPIYPDDDAVPAEPRYSYAPTSAGLTAGMWVIALTQPPCTCDEIWDSGLGLLAAIGTVACRSRPVAVVEAPGAQAWRLTRAEGRQQTVCDRCRGGSGEWRPGELVNPAPRPPR